MNYRNAVLLAHDPINTAGTKTLEITLRDLISRICIQVKATNSSSVTVAHPANIITKIEIVDGSDVLFGLSGKELLAMQYYSTRRTPFIINNYVINVMNITTYEIYFGRYLYDPLLALDPTKFINPQLKITHNLALGGATPTVCTLEVTADIFDEKAITPVGFFMQKENVSYTLSGDANEYIDLPTDHTMRKLLIMSHADDKQPWEQYNTVKLSEDNDKRIPFDDKTSDLLKYFGPLWPAIFETIHGAALTTTRDFYCMSTYEMQLAMVSTEGTSGQLFAQACYGGNIDIRATSGVQFTCLVNGRAPFGALCLPFGIQDNIDDWYDVTKLGSLRLTLKAGTSPGSGSTCEILTEQLRKYGA